MLPSIHLDLTIAFNVAKEPVVYLISPDGIPATLNVSGQAVTAIAFSPDGNLIAVASTEIDDKMGFYNNSRMQIWGLSTLRQSGFPISGINVVTRIFFSSDNQHLLTDEVRQGYATHELSYWDITNSSRQWSYRDLLNGLQQWTYDDPLRASYGDYA